MVEENCKVVVESVPAAGLDKEVLDGSEVSFSEVPATKVVVASDKLEDVVTKVSPAVFSVVADSFDETLGESLIVTVLILVVELVEIELLFNVSTEEVTDDGRVEGASL